MCILCTYCICGFCYICIFIIYQDIFKTDWKNLINNILLLQWPKVEIVIKLMNEREREREREREETKVIFKSSSRAKNKKIKYEII